MNDMKKAKFWEKKTKLGRKLIFESPDKLWSECVKYFEWVEENPLSAAELVKYQGEATVRYVPKMRAMTINGMCLFLGITQRTWENYANRDEFKEVTSHVAAVISTQKFEGAAADLLSPVIIARDLGLKDTNVQEIKDGGKAILNVSFAGDKS